MGIEERFCPRCVLGFLEDHPEDGYRWMKCPCCGFCKPKDMERQREIIERQDTRNDSKDKTK